MLLSTRHALVWALAGTVAGSVLSAAYLAMPRQKPVHAFEPFIGVVILSAFTAALVVWLVRKQSRKDLRDLSKYVVSLREDPALHKIQSLSPEWGPLYQQLDMLGKCYRQALGDFVTQKQALEDLQYEQKQADSALQSLEGRADAEPGHGVFRIRRWDTNSRNMVARLTPNLHWMAATVALQQYLGQSYSRLNGRPFLE